MRAAYQYQVINLLVAIMMVPLLLRYLDVNEYILWSIFTTLGGITLQFESAIQMISVREIAREYYAGNAITLQAAVRKAKTAYMALSASVLVPALALGLLYLHYVAGEKLANEGSIEWLLFISTYALNYYFGTNNSIQLGMGHVAKQNNINSLTRTFNFVCTYILLKAGFSIMGICLSFLLSVLVGCLINLRAARKSLENYYVLQENGVRPDAKFEHYNSSNIVKYTFYLLSSFALYKGCFLIATAVIPQNDIAAYGLTLQAIAIISALALVPVQVWLHRLVSAISSGNQQEILRQLAVTMLAVNTIFFAGSVLLALFGNMLLVFIGSKVMLTGNINLLLIFLAFFVELNIFLLVNFLVTVGNYKFVKVYVTTSLFGIGLVVILAWTFRINVVTLIAVPLGLQVFLCLPLIFRRTCRELAITPLIFLSQLCSFSRTIMK